MKSRASAGFLGTSVVQSRTLKCESGMRASRLLMAAALIGLAGVAVPTVAAAQASKPTVMGHSAEGKADCLSCHATGTEGAKAIPADHAERPNESCQLCHAKDAVIQTKDAPAYKHTSKGRTNCLMCHKDGKMKAPVTAAETHQGAMDNKFCGYCHKEATP
jgi:hypothetical protein